MAAKPQKRASIVESILENDDANNLAALASTDSSQSIVKASPSVIPTMQTNGAKQNGAREIVTKDTLSRLAALRDADGEPNGQPNGPDMERRPSNFSTHSLHIDDAGLMISKKDPMFVPGMRQQLFVDADMMKQRARANLAVKEYKVTDYYSKDGWAANIARSERFNNISLLVIMLNAIWIGVETDYNHAEHLSEADPGFQAGEHLFCIFFVGELLIRFLAFEEKINSLLDGWFRFDLLLVIFIVLDTWILGAGGVGNVVILRLFRLLRLTRIVRLMRSVPEIMTIFKGMTASTRSVLTTLFVLLVFTYAFSIVFRVFLKGEDHYNQYFGTIVLTMWTLFITGALFDNLTEVLSLLRKDNAWLCLCFLLYMILAAFVTLNMLIGILCEVISAVQQAEKEKILVQFVKSRLEKVLEDHGLGKKSDDNEDGSVMDSEDAKIDRPKFHELMSDPRICQSLEDLGIEANHMVCLGDSMFEEEIFERTAGEVENATLSRPNLEKEITNQQFMETLIQLRPSNHVSVANIMEFRKFLRYRLTGVERMQDRMQDQIEMLANCLKELSDKDSSSSSAAAKKPGARPGKPASSATKERRPSGSNIVPQPNGESAASAGGKSEGDNPPADSSAPDKIE